MLTFAGSLVLDARYQILDAGCWTIWYPVSCIQHLAYLNPIKKYPYTIISDT